MADSEKKGMSTGMVIAIGVGCLAVGVVGTALAYEMVFVPDAVEAAKKASPSGAGMTTKATV